jgi:dUTP pyrophosphatase
MKARVTKVHENAKMPVRAYSTDAGMDLFYCPPNLEDWEDDASIFIQSGEGHVIGTGLKIEVPEGYMLEIKNKSGIASKKRLLVGACVVDRGYDGEIFVNLNNVGRLTQEIVPGQKIAQGVFVKIETDIELVESDFIYGGKTDRGAGALGSTGDK